MGCMCSHRVKSFGRSCLTDVMVSVDLISTYTHLLQSAAIGHFKKEWKTGARVGARSVEGLFGFTQS